jgi:hypothetical protein
LNGGSFKIDGGNVVGNYNLEGMLDLQGRFTAYNIGTLMYREWYNKMDNLFHGKHTNLYGAPDAKDENLGVLGNLEHFAKWTARSVVKGVITMTPVVPFFSVFRTPQSKYKGLFIDQDIEKGGILGFSDQNGNHEMLHANEPSCSNRFFAENKPDVTIRRFNAGNWQVIQPPLKNHPLNTGFNAYSNGGLLNAVGKAQNAVRSRFNGMFGSAVSKRGMDNYFNAAFAYTPYMYAKRESAILWDNAKMDMAAERMIDGATSLNYKEFKAGAGEVWQAILHKPFADKKREEESHERILKDTSPADGMTKANYEAIRSNEELSWRERIVHARQPEKASEDLKSKPVKKRSDSYMNDAEMQKILRDLHPPTNSIH